MAKKPNKSLDDTEYTTSHKWPVINSYTDKDGHTVKVYKEAYSVEGSNPFSARGKSL